ncbi:hypothetical protein CJ030_MR8G029116 [Morella rubra]|uniref:Uncharacterized protein n=1 Tax=Morella rubra TaxID=262757 RepID=A0A6A1UQG8_9ROSI|nr:hypothetical protein CJ030_MR8G029116 [Morella rubra]
MERVTKVLLILTVLLLVLSSSAEGGRQLKSEEKVEHPQSFFGNGGSGGIGGFLPTPGMAGGIGGIGSGPSSICSFFPTGCVPVQPVNPGGSIGVGSPP